MKKTRITRRLAAVMAADIVGFSTRMEADEVWMVAALRMIWTDILKPLVLTHNGRIVKIMGDGALVEFGSAVDSVECAIAFQRSMAEWNKKYPGQTATMLRIGINLGEVIIEDDDILGDGVNIAARLEAMAPPGGVLISDSVYSQVAGKLSVTFFNIGELPLKNIAKPVSGWRWCEHDAADPQPGPKPGNKPSITILRFSNIGQNIENEYFADGLVNDITATLSRLSGLTVVPRNAQSFHEQALDVRQIARELGVRYILEGSVRQSGTQVRVNVQLIDAEQGVHVWAERYDRKIIDIFAVQDDITLRIATEMQVKLIDGEQARMRYTTTTNVEAWNNYIQGLAHFRSALNREAIIRTRLCLERAQALDPDSAALSASLAFIYYVDARFSGPAKRAELMAIGRSFVDRALELDRNNADAHSAWSMHCLMCRQFDQAYKYIQRALELAPNSSDVLAFSSYVYACTGYTQEALVQIQKAMRMVLVCTPTYHSYHGTALRLLGRHDEAIAAFHAASARAPGSPQAELVITHQQAGHIEQAQSEAARLLQSNVGFSIQTWASTQFYADQAQVQADLEALRAAGLPE
jgi:adenylate cyclase